MEALEVLGSLRQTGRVASADEQAVLARWTSWGAIPTVFDPDRPEFEQVRERLHQLLTPAERAAARQTVLNAHFTDPQIAASMWAAVERLGFAGGPVLEPGCGSGIFLGLAPEAARPVGVEVDPVTAEIARHLNPHADVRAESFAESRFATRFAAVVGNVPFGKIALHDPDGNRGGHTLHNHFAIKSLQHTSPGGVVAVLSSRYLLDARNPAARRELAELGELLGAVRLPAGAHRAIAGTEVVTDLLIFQRHLGEDRGRAHPSWVHTVDVNVDGAQVAVNGYFAEHPEHVLGSLSHRPYPGAGLVVTAHGPLQELPAEIDVVLREITERALARGARIPDDLDLAPRRPAAPGRAADDAGKWAGHIDFGESGFTVVTADGVEPLTVPRTQQAELRALLELRDRACELLQREAHGEDGLEDDRAQLRGCYESYTKRWGPINRFTQRRTGRFDAEGNEVFARVAPGAIRRLRSDPFGPLTTALEVFDEATQTAEPARMLHERVLEPRERIVSTDDPDEAIAVCLDHRGRLDLEELAQLLGREPADTLAVLGDRVFEDPTTGALLPAAEYLSGDVRAKLEYAREQLEERPELGRHVQALSAAVPSDVPLEEIEARLGAVWLSADVHRQFLSEILGDEHVYVEHPGGSTWAVRGNKHSVAATVEWGTARLSAPEIAQTLMQQKPIVVKDRVGDSDKYVVNPQETAAAIDKGELLQERFSEWVWEDPARADQLVAEYNRRFNSVAMRDYSQAGDRLSLPGMARTFTPRQHQRAGVARMLSEPTVGLFHEVGAGKTATMVIGTMELRRLGMVRKPAVVVPNHMLEQFTREWLAIYPQARLLAANSGDLTKDRRREFVARIATHDWDAVVMTRTAFERLPLRPENAGAFIEGQVADLEAMLQRAQGTEGRATVKQLESQLQREREKAKKLMDRPTDSGISFEDSAIDYLVVDEAHDYKNLRTVSKIPGAAIDGSGRAGDLQSKLEYLRSRHGERVATFATATPIANSITEAHVMMRYLRPDRLKATGVDNFDAWAATFGRTLSGIEITADGAGFQQKTRFARFQNVPEMLGTWHVFADVKTAEDLKLPRPELTPNEKGELAAATIVIPPSGAVATYVAQLAERAEAVRGGRVNPTQDNMLKISGDGRKAALDMRLIDGVVDRDETTKLQRVADQIAADWRQHRDRRYLDPATDQLSPTPGALQIVFCDLSTPRATWNAYDELRDQLVERGLPRQAVRFVHEAKNDGEKARLFAACRSGEVAVLIGSTARMGVGTNIQARAVSLHHVDCPWRPADVQQRDGRILRQGNQNDQVSIYRYVTEGSFDAFSWQTVARKWGFTQQVMRGDRTLRSVEDISQEELTAHQVVALASGNPLLMQKHEADTDLAHLQRVQRNHVRSQQQLQARRVSELEGAATAARRADRLTIAIESEVSPTRGEQFALTIDGRRYTERKDAAEALGHKIAAQSRALRGPRGPLGVVGELGGVELRGELHAFPDGKQVVTVNLGDLPVSAADADVDGLSGVPGAKLLRGLEQRINTLPERRDAFHADEERHREAAQQAAEQLAKPFKRADELAAASRRVDELDRQIAEQANTAAASIPERQAELVRLAQEAARLNERHAEIPGHALDRVLHVTDQLLELHRRSAEEVPEGPEHHRRAVLETYAERIASLTKTEERLTADLERRTGSSPWELERQRDVLNRRREEVDARSTEVRAAIANAAIDEPPIWLKDQIGPKPDDAAKQALWVTAVRTAVTAQLQISPGAGLDAGLPAQPAVGHRPHVERATRAIQRLSGGAAGRER